VEDVVVVDVVVDAVVPAVCPVSRVPLVVVVIASTVPRTKLPFAKLEETI
jgi:hypothetical protein